MDAFPVACGYAAAMPNAVVLNAFENPWLPRIAEAMIVLALAWLVAGWWMGGDTSKPALQMTAGPLAASLPKVADIAAAALFGKAEVKPAAHKPAAPVAAAPTRLNIRLLGTAVAGERSSAVMKLGGSKEQVVFIGEAIQPGVILTQVEVDAIIVDNRGRREKVLMAKGSLNFAAAAYMPATAMPAAKIRRQFTRAAIQKAVQDLPKLLTDALAVPHQMNGVPDGFLLQDIVPDSLYAQAGLMNGDVIRKVNGKAVTRPEQGIALFQQLQNASAIDLEITRAGIVQQIHFDIR
ncbi:MAG: type II secretion system protein N [Mariprofundaceae bacterium]|nr:type II secretion system protein N [Mariprofundaceae bacterium]